MIWSYSRYREFLKCQRKWYFSNILASYRSKDPLGREVFLLNQLRSIYAWRGLVVDEVIDKFIVPNLNNKTKIESSNALNYAWGVIVKQLAFAKERKYLLKDLKKSELGNEFCALFEIEYGDNLDTNRIEHCIKDIYISLENILQSNLINNLYLEEDYYLISQRPLSLRFESDTIRGVPDLIVLYKDKPPLIVDWKVHIGTANYRTQLCLYAYILSKIKTHRDFPTSMIKELSNVENFRLIEYQLLRNIERVYQFKNEDQNMIIDLIYTAINDIKLLTGNKKKKDIKYDLFDTANSPNYCINCNFKRICWRR